MLLSTHSERLPVGGQCCAWPGEFWVPKAVHVLLRALLASRVLLTKPDPPKTALTDLFRHQLIDHFLRAIELA